MWGISISRADLGHQDSSNHHLFRFVFIFVLIINITSSGGPRPPSNSSSISSLSCRQLHHLIIGNIIISSSKTILMWGFSTSGKTLKPELIQSYSISSYHLKWFTWSDSLPIFIIVIIVYIVVVIINNIDFIILNIFVMKVITCPGQ